ncbi:hypothetical protein GUJ93_ZPchr0003g17030 [Zizania palustris]|uniref:Reverse transcriptase zinc-binding domain-containing protein n=1 Tax=Zizania palustris TaxID=103762 RepID=A0A8J5VDV5_ZIZPA|nr:hypothetical protein GUJ93_ZPchr0003g17030 [Zizania palustris]
MLKHKILSADNILKRGWPCYPFCQLCMTHLETAQHLACSCSFTASVWTIVTRHFQLVGTPPLPSDDPPQDWWQKACTTVTRNQRKNFSGLLMYLWWNVWKERNRRVFQNSFQSISFVSSLVISDFTSFASFSALEM